ncbi:MAG: hypothetical protein IPO77_21045, partial [Acidobacteria bacterium]|nr:hypothetical protein [Acidobacteriota bacterium]
MNDSLGNPGYYKFPALPDGYYFAKFYPPASIPTGSPNDAPMSTDVNDSDGVLTGPIYQSPIVPIDPAGANPISIDWVDTDQGFYTDWVSIGNTVWLDTNNDGLISSGEAPKPGILVELFDANNDGIISDSSDVGGVNEFIPVARQLTNSGGHYLFTQKTDQQGNPLGLPLVPSNYYVGVSPFNFNPAGAPVTIGGQPFTAGMLLGYASSLTSVTNGGVVTDDPAASQTDTDADNGDDGSRQGVGAPFYVGGVLSGKLVVTKDGEPTGETTQQEGTTGGQTFGYNNTVDGTLPGVPIDDNDSNVTVDFGFFRLALGDVVWLDTGAGAAYNNGVFDPGEAAIPGIRVQLFSADGTTEIPVGPDGILGTADDAPGGMLTNASGQYLFQALPQGTYRVQITPPSVMSAAVISGRLPRRPITSTATITVLESDLGR